jgi:Lectin C-type domain
MKKSSFCIIVSLLWLVPVTMAAPVQWPIADGGNGHYYEAVLIPDGISWTAANEIANNKQGDWHLVTITSAAENAFVYDLVDDDPAFWKRGGTSGNWGGPWIGGYQENDTGPWKWVTGEPFEYKNWGPREPFGNGDKIALFGYQRRMGPHWNDAYDKHMYYGYIIESETMPPPPVIEVSVDIKPGSCPNPLNVRSKGVLPVAVLGTEDFDVTMIDPGTVGLHREGVEDEQGDPIIVSPLRWAYEDVATPFEGDKDNCYDCSEEGPDGFLDLTLKCDMQEIVVALGDVEDGDCLALALEGQVLDGMPIVGEDVVVILKKGKGKK